MSENTDGSGLGGHGWWNKWKKWCSEPPENVEIQIFWPKPRATHTSSRTAYCLQQNSHPPGEAEFSASVLLHADWAAGTCWGDPPRSCKKAQIWQWWSQRTGMSDNVWLSWVYPPRRTLKIVPFIFVLKIKTDRSSSRPQTFISDCLCCLFLWKNKKKLSSTHFMNFLKWTERALHFLYCSPPARLKACW